LLVDPAQPVGVDGLIDGVDELVKIALTLGDVSGGSQFQGGDRGGFVASGGDHDERRQLEVAALGLAREVQSAQVGHPQVDQHQVIFVRLLQPCQGFGAAIDDIHREMRRGFGEVPQGQLNVHRQVLDVEDPAGRSGGG
jgi:hypothetical protein